MILVLNAGSSSLKVALFDRDLRETGRDAVEEIGTTVPDHAAALGLILGRLPRRDLTGAAHRVVHGGPHLTAPARIDDAVIAQIEAAAPLAPLHNPANLAGIRAVARLAPDLPQAASFDTAFHATNDALATTYALPADDRAIYRRYGFHGISYAGIAESVRVPRLLAFHLGNGASACAIRDGLSVATTMGFSPLAGLVMGTRSGDIDPWVALDLAAAHGIDGARRRLTRESGLKGLAGESDMRALLARDDAAARFAVAHFAHWAARQGASLVPAMGGVDALAFSGGIGEHAEPVRAAIVAALAFLGPLPVHVVPAAEERRIAAEAVSTIR